ncbi:MAG: cobyrinate a,c-diamide synthase [Agathobaculum desmolans]|uniref:cobyrinate a,c-diamide synthase n=1 Tax=Agathobaculum desmolans TaxID=39484 RepID=UPI00399504AE
MKRNAPRLLLGGTGSGCGKTTVTLALLRAWQRQGMPLAAFKCGPDYIDPMFHTAVLGVPSRNLDLYFMKETQVCAALARRIPPDGLGVVEGAMGFYDGVSGTTDTASAAHLARVAAIPAVLIVRPKGQSLSLAAELHGFRTFAENTLAGVILNGVSSAMYPFYRTIAERSGLRVYGFLPPVAEAAIPDRHLGLVTAAEIEDLQYRLDRLADAAEQGLDLDGLAGLARTAPPLEEHPEQMLPTVSPPVRIAVAQDSAFCFYYADNLERLASLGAELVQFSPLEDASLPEGTDGLYLGGGYPELYAERLAANVSMRESVRGAIARGLPAIAECGGFQYLHRTLNGYPMAGVLPLDAHISDRLQPFGYVELTAAQDNLLCRKGERIRAHEFHYGVSSDAGDGFIACKPNGRTWPCAYVTDTLYAGYPHLYFGSNPDFAGNFVQKCAAWRKQHDT